MKKILLLSNGFSLSKNTVAYAVYVAKNNKAALYALQLSSLNPKEPGNITSQDIDSTGVDEETIINLENDEIERFQNMCKDNDIECKICKIRHNFLDSVIDQSIFGDLIICDEKIDERKFSLNSLMVNAHCPVLSVPDDASPFTEIILTFDESSSSMHSIKQFSYLFSSWLHLPTYIVSVLPQNVIGLEYRELLSEWLQFYYPAASIEILKGKPGEVLPHFINKHENAIVVMGSFGRSPLSRMFKDSLANIILAQTKSVVFTTHD